MEPLIATAIHTETPHPRYLSHRDHIASETKKDTEMSMLWDAIHQGSRWHPFSDDSGKILAISTSWIWWCHCVRWPCGYSTNIAPDCPKGLALSSPRRINISISSSFNYLMACGDWLYQWVRANCKQCISNALSQASLPATPPSTPFEKVFADSFWHHRCLRNY